MLTAAATFACAGCTTSIACDTGTCGLTTLPPAEVEADGAVDVAAATSADAPFSDDSYDYNACSCATCPHPLGPCPGDLQADTGADAADASAGPDVVAEGTTDTGTE